MWEGLSKTPLGRMSMRNFILFVATVLVTCFAYIFILTPTAHAEDASWRDDGTLMHDNHRYSGPETSDGNNGLTVPDGATYYYWDNPNSGGNTSNRDRWIIYFASNTDPPTASSATLLRYTYDGTTYSNPRDEEDINFTNSTQASTTSNNPSSCQVDGVGWIVCSMSNWIAEGVDYIYGVISDFFYFEPLSTSGNSGSIYQMWKVVSNIANVLFIIGFLVLIYAQITGSIASNYTIKKTLPRIIIAAVLVNISFWICAVGIDLSNILGVAVQNMFADFRESLGAANIEFPAWKDVTLSILSGSGLVIAGIGTLAATGGTVGGLAFLLLGALVPVIFAVLIAVTILAARQALLTILVIISPLAFVAYLLPNTEDWFNKWRKFFITLLVMFPAFSVIFGGSQLAGNIIIQNADGSIAIALLGLTVQVIPLFITPFLFKLSTGLLGTIAGLANDRSKGVFDRTSNWAKDNRELHRQRGFSARPNRRGDRFRPTGLARRVNNSTLKREGMTAAHKSVSAARFEDTKAGQKISERNKRAGAYKHAADATNERQWSETMDRSQYLQKIHTRSRVDSGVAKLSEEYHNAHADLEWEKAYQSDKSLYERSIKKQNLSKQVKAAQEEWESILLEASAGDKTDYQKKFGRGPVTQSVQVAFDGLKEVEAKIAAEAYRKSNAENKRQGDLTEALLKNNVRIDGIDIQSYAGGIRGAEGAETVLASAIAKERKEYAERIGEKTQLIKHFNLSSTQRQDLAMDRGDQQATRPDGTSYVFRKDDEYVKEAVIEQQLKAGSFGEIEEIIKSSGNLNLAYRTTISDAVVSNGLAAKALYFGSKTIDDIAQGKISGDAGLDNATFFHISGGKIKEEVLATQSSAALKRIFELANNPTKSSDYVNASPNERATFDRYASNLANLARNILDDEILSTRVDGSSYDVLQQYAAPRSSGSN